MIQKLLLIEDTPTLQMIYNASLTSAGYKVNVAMTGTEGLAQFRRDNHSVVIMDMFLPDMDGVEVIRKLVRENPQAKIIVITSNGSINRAVEAMRAGAFDFLLKPFSDERLLATVSSALASIEINPEIDFGAGSFYGFTGRGPLMQEMYRKIMRIAPSTAPVFVVGEHGTGKSTCAAAIHEHAGDDARPFVMYSGGDLTPVMQESTLFGAIEDLNLAPKGAETGALRQAYGGTLYINEVAELDPILQSKLGSFLQKASQNDPSLDHAGKAFPRIICSSSIDPQVLLETRKIREDLFYQLHILTVDVPALRERGDDIIFAAEAILARLSRTEKKAFGGLSDEVSELFLTHNWPGNISQLGNLLHKIVATHDARLVAGDMLPVGFSSQGRASLGRIKDATEDRFSIERNSNAIHQLVGLQLDEVEQRFIEATIRAQGGSIPKAAEVLGVAPSTIYRKRSKQ
ncbi:MAG: sigma-54-dependent Fis family transcriptional regulator [Amylibacter sp.]|nr:sigma-54-dependent Fis family transcriptional regulator [Amylibacter sp.]